MDNEDANVSEEATSNDHQELAPPSGEPIATSTGANTNPAGTPNISDPNWYNGPLPINLNVGTESFGAAIGKSVVKSIVGLATVGLGFLMMILLFVGCTSALTANAVSETSAMESELIDGEETAETKFVAVPITGVILTEDRGQTPGIFSAALDSTYGYTIKEQLAELAEDETVDGIMLEMDTPGGTITGSKAIADAVAEYKEATGNPVVAHVSGISASGGMYSMAGADYIVADHGTFTGSIGVIIGPFAQYKSVTAIDGGILGGGVTTEEGITVEYLTAGKDKAAGNPFEPLSPEFRSVMQTGLDDAYGDFVDHVASNRDVKKSDVIQEMGAHIFGEQQALRNGLIDEIGSPELAREKLAALSEADDGDWKLVRPISQDQGLLSLLSGNSPVEQPATSLSSQRACEAQTLLLAFHGDPASLCGAVPTAE